MRLIYGFLAFVFEIVSLWLALYFFGIIGLIVYLLIEILIAVKVMK